MNYTHIQKNTCAHTHIYTYLLVDTCGTPEVIARALTYMREKARTLLPTPFSCFLRVIYKEALLILPLHISRVDLLLFLSISSTLNQTSVMIWLTYATGGPYYCRLQCWISRYCTRHSTNCFPYNWLMTFSWVCKCLWTGAHVCWLIISSCSDHAHY